MLWGELLHVAAQNGVLIRVVDQLQVIGLEPRHFFYAAVKEMRARNQRKLSLMARIGERCVDANIDFIFAKALQNYPDMGGDIDLYVKPRSIDVDAAILTGLKATPVKRNLRNRIDGTATYWLAGCDSLLDIHHGGVGMLGEHKLYVSQIIRNAREITVDGDDFLPSPEDQLILQALQKVQRSYLRLSDILTTIKLVRGERLDWNYILNTVRPEYSLWPELLSQLCRPRSSRSFRKTLVSVFAKSLISKNTDINEFKDGFYRFPRW